jgi:hypothetical protein
MKESIKELDDELTNALRREEPPAGFVDRVLSRVAEQAQDPRTWGLPLGGPTPLGGSIRLSASARAARYGETSPKPGEGGKPDPTTMKNPVSFLQWAAAAALVAAMAGGINYVAEQKERAEGEAAGVRVALALHIAGTKLQLVQTKITQLHEQPDTNSNQ